MSRIKITEYAAKHLLVSGYAGVTLRTGKEKLPKGALVVKVDQGVKKRMKQGLLKVGVTAAEAKQYANVWRKKGYTNFLVEPVFAHDAQDEQYFSLERVRNGVRLLHARDGGIDIESHPEAVYSHIVTNDADTASAAAATGLPETFVRKTLDRFAQEHMTFLELNPLVVTQGVCVPLDAAALLREELEQRHHDDAERQ